jgi:hypothetical protein
VAYEILLYRARNLLSMERKAYLISQTKRGVEAASSCPDMAAFEKRSSKL